MSKELIDFFEREFSDIINKLSNNFEHRASVPSVETITTYFNNKGEFDIVFNEKNLFEKNNEKYYIQNLNSKDRLLQLYLIYVLGKIKSYNSVDKIIDFLSTNDNELLSFSIRALGEIGDSTAMPHLMSLLNETEEELIKKEVIIALGLIGDPIAVLPLTNLVNDSKYKAVSIEALGNIADTMSIETLIKYLNDEDGFIRAKVAYALRKFKTDLAINPLIAALNDSYPDVANMAAYSLGQIQSPKAVNALINAYVRENISLDALLGAIYKIGKNAVPALVKLLSSDDYDILLVVIKLLGELGDDSCVDELIKVFEKEFVVDDSLDSDGFLDVFLIEEILGAFNKIGSVKTLPYILKALDVKYPTIVEAAKISLNSVFSRLKKSDLNYVISLTNSYKKVEFNSLIVKYIGENSIKAGANFLFSLLNSSKDYNLKREIGVVLGKFGDKRALGILSEMLNDPEEKYAKLAKVLISKLS